MALADECPGDESADCPIINNLAGAATGIRLKWFIPGKPLRGDWAI